MNLERVEALAQKLVAARRQSKPAVIESALDPVDAAEAYAVQERVAALLYGGLRATAWKVGAPNLSVTPTASPIRAPLVLISPARYEIPALTGLSIEAEVAFRVSRDVTDANADPASVFDRMLVTIEVCDSRIADPGGASARLKLADFQVSAALVLGTGRDDWAGYDLSTQRCVVSCDGAVVFDRRSWHSLGDPRCLLPWLLAHASARGGLRAGDVVTTGTWCGMVPVRPGATIEVTIDDIGAAQVTFAAAAI
jgi:2-keto-4-pentenoate hydratase